MANKSGFSWKRAFGVTKLKNKITRKTGIPLTKAGRQRKVGKMITGGGCVMYLLAAVGIVVIIVVIVGFIL